MSEKILKNLVIVLCVLALTYILTFAINGKKESSEQEFQKLDTGKDVLINIEGQNELMDVEQYIAGVLPYEIDETATLEVACAQAVAIRTSIYFTMGDKTVIEGEKLNYKYMTDREGEKNYGREGYAKMRKICQQAVVETCMESMK